MDVKRCVFLIVNQKLLTNFVTNMIQKVLILVKVFFVSVEVTHLHFKTLGLDSVNIRTQTNKKNLNTKLNKWKSL